MDQDEAPQRKQRRNNLMEIIKRLNGRTLWQGRDAEGRGIYEVTKNREGIAIEPTGTSIYYSKSAALNSIEEE